MQKSKIGLDFEKVEHARGVARKIAGQVQDFVDNYTTPYYNLYITSIGRNHREPQAIAPSAAPEEAHPGRHLHAAFHLLHGHLRSGGGLPEIGRHDHHSPARPLRRGAHQSAQREGIFPSHLCHHAGLAGNRLGFHYLRRRAFRH